MLSYFDSHLEAKRLVRMVKAAFASRKERSNAEVEIALASLAPAELEALALELEENFENRFGVEPYARIVRDSRNKVKAIRFYAGWLDLRNIGKELMAQTYRLSFDNEREAKVT